MKNSIILMMTASLDEKRSGAKAVFSATRLKDVPETVVGFIVYNFVP